MKVEFEHAAAVAQLAVELAKMQGDPDPEKFIAPALRLITQASEVMFETKEIWIK